MASTTFDVKAILKADSSQFKSGVNQAKSALSGLKSSTSKMGSVFKGALGANLVAGGISKAISAIGGGIGGMVTELNASKKAWDSFNGNMQILGKSDSQISRAKKSMQGYAATTIYSASDMASTYAQLAAVGVKDTGRLVKGMGGLAASAENPKQAMKTLSQQMTQMASKPTVAWQDYKLMLEQSPAGMAAVAKKMGMSMSEMQTAIQDGTLSTKDFMKAVADVGNSKGFQKMATNFKTVGEAVDGMKEGLANKLQPAFAELTAFGIKAVNSISKSLGNINFDGLAGKLKNILGGINIDSIVSKIGSAFSQIGQFIGKFANTGVFSALGGAIKSVAGAIRHVMSAFSGGKGDWTDFGTTVGNVAKKVAQGAKAIGDFVSKLDPGAIQAAAGAVGLLFAAFKIAKLVQAAKSITSVFTSSKDGASTAGAVIKSVFSGIANVLKTLGTAIATAAKGIGTGLATAFQGLGRAISMVPPTTFLALAVAILATGVAVYIAAQGFSIMADAAIRLGQAGLGAQIMFGLMIAGIVALVAVVGIFGAGLSAGAIGMLAFGAAAIMVGIAIAIIATQAEGVATIIHAIADAFSVVAGAVAAAIATILGAIAPLLPGIAMIITAIAPIVIQFIQLFRDIVPQISPIIDSVSNLFQTLGQQIANILQAAGDVITSFGNSVRTVLDGLSGVFDSIGTAALNAGKGVKLMAQGLQILTNLPLGDLTGTLTVVAAGLSGIAGSGIAEAGPGLMIAGQGLTMIATGAMMAQGALTALPAVITAFTTSLTTLPTQLATAQTALMTFATSAVSSLAGLASAGAMIMAFGAQLTTIVASTATANAGLSSFNAQANSAGSALSQLGSFATTASAQITTLGATITSSMAMASATVTSAGQRMSVSMQSAMNQMVSNVRNGMSNMTNAVRSGMSNMVAAFRAGGQQMISAAQSMVNQTANTIRSGYGAMVSAGAYLTQGVASGMRSAMGSVQAAAQQIISIANQAAQAAAQIHSPSRLFRDQVGYYIGAGIAVGIEKSESLVAKSMGFIQDSVNAFKIDTASLSGSMDMAQSALSGSVSLGGNTTVGHTFDSVNVALSAKLDELVSAYREGSPVYLDGMSIATNVDTHMGSIQARKGRRSF
ncbi:hypothetical protein BI362_00930 [Streptococcus parauberis]|nr:hypothetical protein BI362_00930 [Streptococcus parauberis]QBX27694.1 tail fibers protein [Streptococcus phage Javan406]